MAFGRFGSVGAGFGRGGPAGASGYPPHNLIVASKDASIIEYGNATVTVNTTAGPLGDVTADTCAFAASNYLYKGIAGASVIGTAYCGAVWLKAAAPVQIGIRFTDNSGGTAVAVVNVTTAWQQFSLTFVSVGVNRIDIGLDTRTGITGDDGLAKTVIAADWQINRGTTPTAYVPT